MHTKLRYQLGVDTEGKEQREKGFSASAAVSQKASVLFDATYTYLKLTKIQLQKQLTLLSSFSLLFEANTAPPPD